MFIIVFAQLKFLPQLFKIVWKLIKSLIRPVDTSLSGSNLNKIQNLISLLNSTNQLLKENFKVIIGRIEK